MNADDPKFTAYLLDELDPAERAAVEAELRRQPALAAELAEMRCFAAQLRGALHAEEGAPLLAEQRAAVLGQAPRIVTGPRAWWRRPWVQSAVAACVVVGAIVAAFVRMEMKTPQIAPSVAVRVRGMELKMEPEPEAKEGPGDFMGLPTTAPELAEAKPPRTNLPLDPVGPVDSEIRSAAPTEDGSDKTDLVAGSIQDRLATGPSAGVGKKTESADSRQLPERSKSAASGTVPSRLFARFPADLPSGGEKTSAPKGKVAKGFPIGDFPVTPTTPIDYAKRAAASRETFHYRNPASEPEPQGNTESYETIPDNAFLTVKDQPLSTFAVDVDTASYANVRRLLNANERPPKGAVRIEELVNYFRYDYARPEGADPFACALEVATCPWQTEHRLVRIGLKGREIKRENRPAANLVFLIDVSGSMQPENRLPLVKKSLGLLVDQLSAEDTVSIAVYAGASGCVLEPTHDRNKMRAALDRLEAGGSTNGAAGIQLAYELAQRSFKKGGTNRVILCTDGDFNVGITSQSELVAMIQDKAKTGIFLSVFGVGMGNLKDATLEKLADKGHGNYGYIDTLAEGRKVFVEQMTGTIFTIAKDVKVQVEFNPAQVAAYRLIGYENRLLAKEDFNDDTKDGGDVGAGHTVTALYEVVPAGKEVPGAPVVDDLKYQSPEVGKSEIRNPKSETSTELLTVKVRYKQPDGDVSKKLEFPLTDRGATWEKSSRDFRWAASVASFGLLLRDSPHKGSANWSMTLELATEGKGEDRDGYRAEFVGLVEKARGLSR